MMKIAGDGGEPKRALMGYDEARSRKVVAHHRFLSPSSPSPSPAEKRPVVPMPDSLPELEWAEESKP